MFRELTNRVRYIRVRATMLTRRYGRAQYFVICQSANHARNLILLLTAGLGGQTQLPICSRVEQSNAIWLKEVERIVSQ
jgi:hypothetical protein